MRMFGVIGTTDQECVNGGISQSNQYNIIIMKLKIKKALFWFDKKFGWFFTNGRNQEYFELMIEEEEEEIRRLEKLR